MTTILSIKDLRKSYAGGFEALKGVSLDIEQGEILALLGPNGAGKTTLISTVCGITTPTSGTVTVGGHDIQSDFRAARRMIGLVPQEIALEPFEKVWNTVRFSRGLFGHRRDDARIEEILRKLSLWDKRKNAIKELSGGMKRRVLIAKALAHEPRVLFLDEPTAGVSPIVMDELFDRIIEVARTGLPILMVEQNAKQALEIADKGYVLVQGRNAHTGSGKALLADPEVRASFLGG